jgi:hypothetical protein
VGQRQIISISAEALTELVRFSAASGDARAVDLPPRAYGELRAILNHYWSHLLGHPARMHRYLGTAAS